MCGSTIQYGHNKEITNRHYLTFIMSHELSPIQESLLFHHWLIGKCQLEQTSFSYWTSRSALLDAKSWITASACLRMSSRETVRLRRSRRGVTRSWESELASSGEQSSSRCSARSRSNEIAYINNWRVSNGRRNGLKFKFSLDAKVKIQEQCIFFGN